MKHITMTVTLALLLTTSQAFAQAPAGVVTEDLLKLKRESLSVSIDHGGFFDGVAIERDGQRISIGFFGGDASPFFTQQGLAQDSLRAYRNQKIAGVSLWSVGMAALVADLGLTVHSIGSSNARSQGRDALQWSLLGAGAVTGIVGAILLHTATGHLMEAVSSHNSTQMDQAIDRSMQTRPSLGVGVGVGSDGHGGSVSMTMPF